jgi:glycerol-3-phosphate dehydrogenase
MNDRRHINIERLRSETWDVLVVGGGINGAGIVRDLALRDAGLKIALFEKSHFSSGTSGKNSQLIHGGLRYLKYFDVGLVKEALRERATLLKTAPGLVQPLQFLIPCYSAFARWFYGAGLMLYDALSGGRSIGKSQALNAAETRALEPDLAPEKMRAGLLFYDGRVNSARLVLENLLDAQARGACIANYVEWVWDSRQAEARDTLTGEVFPLRARKIVDATGAWSAGGAPLRLVRGSHLVFPRIQRGREAIAYFDEQGRIVFLIPWGEHEDLTLVGTTDVDHAAGPDEVGISAAEADYLNSIVHRLFPAYRAEPVAAYSSLRPLIAEQGRSATSTSREHRIWETEDSVIHIGGGKYTTYRLMSEELVDTVLSEIRPGRHLPCRTAETPLDIPELPAGCSDRVRMAVEREFARKLEDLLFVSTYWGYERRLSRDWLAPLARTMGSLLGWSEPSADEEVSACLMRQFVPRGGTGTRF